MCVLASYTFNMTAWSSACGWCQHSDSAGTAGSTHETRSVQDLKVWQRFSWFHKSKTQSPSDPHSSSILFWVPRWSVFYTEIYTRLKQVDWIDGGLGYPNELRTAKLHAASGSSATPVSVNTIEHVHIVHLLHSTTEFYRIKNSFWLMGMGVNIFHPWKQPTRSQIPQTGPIEWSSPILWLDSLWILGGRKDWHTFQPCPTSYCCISCRIFCISRLFCLAPAASTQVMERTKHVR